MVFIDSLLTAAQRQAFAAARVLINAGQLDAAAIKLQRAVDWDDEVVYTPLYGVGGWRLFASDLMPRGWFYLAPHRALGHPTTVRLFDNSESISRAYKFPYRRPSIVCIDENAAIREQADDLAVQLLLADVDPDEQ